MTEWLYCGVCVRGECVTEWLYCVCVCVCERWMCDRECVGSVNV